MSNFKMREGKTMLIFSKLDPKALHPIKPVTAARDRGDKQGSPLLLFPTTGRAELALLAQLALLPP